MLGALAFDEVVWVMVLTAGATQVRGSANLSAAPCRIGRPLVPELARQSGEVHHPVAAQPTEHFDRQVDLVNPSGSGPYFEIRARSKIQTSLTALSLDARLSDRSRNVC